MPPSPTIGLTWRLTDLRRQPVTRAGTHPTLQIELPSEARDCSETPRDLGVKTLPWRSCSAGVVVASLLFPRGRASGTLLDMTLRMTVRALAAVL